MPEPGYQGVYLDIASGRKQVLADGYTEGWGIVLDRLVEHVREELSQL